MWFDLEDFVRRDTQESSFPIAFLAIFYDARVSPILAPPAKMVNPLPMVDLPRAVAIAVSVTVLGVAVRRRYFSPISDVPGPFWGSFSMVWQLRMIFGKHMERATINAHKKWGILQSLAG
jgi:hypothetical protein